jgi:hypothetical protein
MIYTVYWIIDFLGHNDTQYKNNEMARLLQQSQVR